MKTNTIKNNGATKISGVLNTIKSNKAKTFKSLNVFDAKIVAQSFKLMTTNSKENVGSTTNKNTNQLALSFCPKTASLALIKHFKLTSATVKANEGVVYNGLSKKLASQMFDRKMFCSDDKEVWITMVNNDMVDELINDMRNCDLNNEDNLEKIFWDLTVIYRMYQERIIDSAKKAYIVEIKIALECFRALSLQKTNHILKYGDDDEIEVKNEIEVLAGSTESRILIYKATPVREKDGVELKYFRDPITVIQRQLAEYLEDLVNAAAEIEVEMSEEEVQRLLAYKGEGPVADLSSSVKYGYYVLSRNYRETISEIDRDEQADLYKRVKEEYNKATDTLKIVTRQLLDGYAPQVAASIMQLTACMNSDGFNPKSTNQMAINLTTEEYMTSIVENVAEVKVMGYKVASNVTLTDGTKDLKEGDVVEFVTGVSDNGSVIDFGKEIVHATGMFRIEKFNGSLYAVQDIKFNIPKADYTKRVFFVRPERNMDINAVIDALKEGSSVTVKRDGTIKKSDIEIAEVKYEGNGEGIELLLGVTGTVSYLKVVEIENRQPLIMFELSEVEEIETIEDNNYDDIEIESDDLIVKDEIEDIEIEVDDIDFDEYDEEDIEIELE